MSIHAYDDVRNKILGQIQLLAPHDQLRLLDDLAAIIQQSSGVAEQPHHSITELKGLGKEVWEGIDVKEYIREERRLWDG